MFLSMPFSRHALSTTTPSSSPAHARKRPAKHSSSSSLAHCRHRNAVTAALPRSASSSDGTRSSHNGLNSTVTTTLSTLFSDIHGRQRRQERSIEKLDLQLARKYGMAEPQPNERTKFTWGGVTFIYDPKTNQEITCYISDERRQLPEQACTRYVKPVLLSKRSLSANEKKRVTEWTSHVQQYHDQWKSHSVFVIDMSGSMRLDDVRGARCRSDGIFLALARDFIGKPLEQGLLDEYHVVSLVIMQDSPTVLFACQPVTWNLYNQLIDCREWNNLRPAGQGQYYPALTKAVELLNLNKSPHCSLSLYFCSDGVPSDPPHVVKNIPKLISDLAAQPWAKIQRLTVTCVGMGGLSLLQKQEAMQTLSSLSSLSSTTTATTAIPRLRTADWTVLNSIVQAAKEQGAVATLELPSASDNTTSMVALSSTISSLLSSITTGSTAFSPMQNSLSPSFQLYIHQESHCPIRKFVRESFVERDDDCVTSGGWTIYDNNHQRLEAQPERFVRGIRSWDPSADNAVSIIQDPRCVAGMQHGDNNGHHSAIPSFSAVTIKNAVFGEGAERIVRKFRFLNGQYHFVGGPWVAKESRFADDVERQEQLAEHAHEYHATFMRSQALAAKYASLFNERLNALNESLSPKFHKWIHELPRVGFLKTFVVELVDGGKFSHVLVEEMLPCIDYRKYNNNAGHVAAPREAHIRYNAGDLLTIDEEEYDEDSLDDVVEMKPPEPGCCCNFANIRVEDIPQAFSHFTYTVSKGELMVVDLQGIIKREPDGRREFVLTDPAIHSRRHRRREDSQHQQQPTLGPLGRTDQGERGLRAFWQSHVCSDACRLLGLVPKK